MILFAKIITLFAFFLTCILLRLIQQNLFSILKKPYLSPYKLNISCMETV